MIDADPGIGDALAIALALLDNRFDVVGLTATSGVVSGKVASRNMQSIVEIIDPSKRPRIGASNGPAFEEESMYRGSSIRTGVLNGKTGLGNWLFDVPELHSPRESAKVLTDLVREFPHEITLLTLGPLTNIEIACERFPEFFSLLGGLVTLGGSIQGLGDVTAGAEFNIYANPEAARNVLTRPATKTLLPLEVSKKAVLTFSQFDRLTAQPSSSLMQFIREVIPFALRTHHELLGLEGISLCEVAALVTIAEPRQVETLPMTIDVETAGELTRGMTIFDQRGTQQWQTNIDVITDIDPQGVLDYFMRHFNSA